MWLRRRAPSPSLARGSARDSAAALDLCGRFRLRSESPIPHAIKERRPMELERPLPTPITPEAKPYWEGLREQKLMLPRCRACRRAFLYPRVLCPFCHASDIEWFQASGRGKLYSFEIAYQTINKAFKVKPPYVLAMIELEEG